MKNAIVKAAFELKSSHVCEKRSNTFFYIVILSLTSLACAKYKRVLEYTRRILPYKRLMALCPWMRSHFHDWIDYDGVAFSIELLE